MARILLAWELGSNYGHISVLLPLARRLRQQGHDILFAARDIKILSPFMESHGFVFVQAPFVPGFRPRHREPLSFADILDEAGFGDIDVLAALVAGWQNLFKLYAADILVGEYAPIAQFAARITGLPCLHLNTGFGLPPDSGIFPCFRPWRKPTREQLLEQEERVLDSMNAIRFRYGFPGFANLQPALKSDIDLLTTLPELDHYQRRDTRKFIGPIVMSDDGIEGQWPEKREPRIFLYLRPGPGIRMILETLKDSKAGVIAVIPGLDNTLRQTYTDDRIQIFTSRVKLSLILNEMDLAITHSGHGTASVMLLSGVPMLLLPTTIEQWMLSRVLTKQGVGIAVNKYESAVNFPQALEKLCSDSRFREKAEQLAKKYSAFQSDHVLDRLTTTIERLPEWKRKKHVHDVAPGRRTVTDDLCS